MTTMTLDTNTEAAVGRPTLDELVDRLLTAILGDTGRTAPGPAQAIHEARRLRQSGDLDGALNALAYADTRQADDAQLRWLYAEWQDVARRRFPDCGTLLYSPATGRAAALVPAGNDDGKTLEVVAVLGMRWSVGKLVSRRTLRGLKPLHNSKGGSSWL